MWELVPRFEAIETFVFPDSSVLLPVVWESVPRFEGIKTLPNISHGYRQY